MKVAVASDHGGFPMKAQIVQLVQTLGHEVIELGAFELQPADDYPDFAAEIGTAIQQERAERGILLCGSGVGACVAANKLKGIRAGLCHDHYSAAQGVEHDDINVLCLGARVVGPAVVEDLVTAFVNAKYSGEERHQRRLEKVKALERSSD
ncbi:MAG: ribose 5-phosphate isomerase B [Planctomycetaceae bacterium]|nr:ribose 5-phosphate isomerase B [Planctomycetaceae bacterium]